MTRKTELLFFDSKLCRKVEMTYFSLNPSGELSG